MYNFEYIFVVPAIVSFPVAFEAAEIRASVRSRYEFNIHYAEWGTHTVKLKLTIWLCLYYTGVKEVPIVRT